MKRFSASAIAALLSVTAQAQVGHAKEFAVTGQSSVPTSLTIHDGLYVTAFPGDVSAQWTFGKTGTITLHSAISLDITSPSHLWIMFKNNRTCGGCGSDNVTVSYMKMNKSTGVLSTIKTMAASDGETDGDLDTLEDTFSDTYDVAQYYYYVKIEMNRASTNDQKFYAAVVW